MAIGPEIIGVEEAMSGREANSYPDIFAYAKNIVFDPRNVNSGDLNH
jgi:hypothetical protein